jgi:hypothetical protein
MIQNRMEAATPRRPLLPTIGASVTFRLRAAQAAVVALGRGDEQDRHQGDGRALDRTVPDRARTPHPVDVGGRKGARVVERLGRVARILQRSHAVLDDQLRHVRALDDALDFGAGEVADEHGLPDTNLVGIESLGRGGGVGQSDNRECAANRANELHECSPFHLRRRRGP